ncbi:hypothetical protein OPQ81_000761 [Rhizoctonia solani]|nr:hypothetical protein OPQ81_000761 [Rhizoctonia solani]
MDRYLEDEMRGAIFCDPKFSENFLSIDEEHRPLLDEQLSRLPTNIHLLDDSITTERRLYEPILEVLRSIKQVVDTVRVTNYLGVLGTTFRDFHTTVIQGDDPDTHLIKPDLVLFEDDDPARYHWETVMIPVEVKAKHTYLKVGMKQLTRYARAAFAHQIHRRHLYGMVICKWAATFVRFDRSGIVHSEPIDMLHNYEEFRRAFAGLMMLDRRAFGYDTAFTTERPFPPDATALEEGSPDNPALNVSPTADSAHQPLTLWQFPPRRFKVMERLCHRKSINGRATIVLRLREVREGTQQPEPGPTYMARMTRSRTQSQRSKPKWEEVPGRDYVLKLMWRNPNKRQEGETLKRLEGEYGVAQCQWYGDVLQWGASCHKPGATSCNKCCDMTPAKVLVQQVNNLGDLDVEVAWDTGEEEIRYAEVETGGRVGELFAQRMPRIYSWALFSTVGRLLWTAESPRQFLEAVLDAMLGYWQVVNQGVLHRDISDGNVLIAEPGQSYSTCKWGKVQESTVEEGGPQNTRADDPLADSRRLAEETIRRLGRDPTGFLSDFDLSATHGGMGSEFYDEADTADQNSGYPTPSADADADAGPNAKRLRRDDGSPGVAFSPSARGVQRGEQLGASSVVPSGHQGYRLIDFRTGTPTFMSIRVLRVKIDPKPDGNERNRPTEMALTILHDLDRADSNFRTLAHSKRELLANCSDGSEDEPPSIVDMLEECENSWANHPAFVSVIVGLGAHFGRLYAQRNPFSRCTPATEFPELVRIISSALESL